MTVNELANKAQLTPVSVSGGDREVQGAYCGDLLSWVMGRASCDCAWITIMSNINVVAVATLVDVACVILAEGVIAEKEVIDAAAQKNINILSSGKSAYELAVDLGKLL